MMRGAIEDRAWRAYAEGRTRLERRGSNRSALDSFGTPERDELEAWNDVMARRFDRYRQDHPVPSDPVTIICVSKRPRELDRIVGNVARQVGVDADLVLVTNDGGYADVDVEAAVAGLGSVLLLDTPSDMSLGACLNRALAASSTRYVAKFDDDDHYGPGFLADGLRALAFSGAALVGKHTYYAELASTGERYLRFPGHEFSYSPTLAGGTLLIDRGRVGDLWFDDISLGEDRAFIAACHRRGWATFAADRFNFIQCRGADNTWSVPDERFLAGCRRVDRGDWVHAVDR